MLKAVFAGVALVIGASQASAQITTFVAPPRAQASSPMVVAAADSARRDSVAQVAMTNMKVWVDSAAGVSVPTHVGDSTAANDPGDPGDPGRPVTTTFADGSVAPATASDLPTVALLGVLVCAIGAALLATRPRT